MLKDRLSEYLRIVASGEVVLVTDHDRVVAELVPPGVGRAEKIDDAQLAELVRRGWLVPAAIHSNDPPPRILFAPTADLLRELNDARNDSG